ncbi:MAG: tRNA (guanosine(37)-N1)-methyltransferase TrmD [Candidatus Auribacter fodinae]|jgi:tRNA (guanine37-N1)-methyltransferase|uniref:tRNA (guanine-N(1)-)-methyltransferase n=1 Tax=Candidatus Auribacter fodinae TaxID=2093366 RepID=A0A3A4QRP9_9BACT|nr:MAG: tRNA (guanosine(37)-N1)-methyltransferase TrmD [Candidatus Auribacter fodinae]
MRIDILSIFSENYFAPLNDSIVKRAQESGVVQIGYRNLRDYTDDLHRTVDDRPYGGGPGMVFKLEPLYNAITDIKREESVLICPSPCGEVLCQSVIKDLLCYKHIIFICGHYEGIDDRINNLFPVREISIGDYVLTSGALASTVIIDAVVRQIPGVVGCGDSVLEDSFYDGLLDHPHYTRPAEFMGLRVPEVLLSGNHHEIAKWRKEKAEESTKRRRPDLWERYMKSKHIY